MPKKSEKRQRLDYRTTPELTEAIDQSPTQEGESAAEKRRRIMLDGIGRMEANRKLKEYSYPNPPKGRLARENEPGGYAQGAIYLTEKEMRRVDYQRRPKESPVDFVRRALAIGCPYYTDPDKEKLMGKPNITHPAPAPTPTQDPEAEPSANPTDPAES